MHFCGACVISCPLILKSFWDALLSFERKKAQYPSLIYDLHPLLPPPFRKHYYVYDLLTQQGTGTIYSIQ